MRATRLLVALAGLAVVAVEPAAAQPDSVTEELIWGLNNQLLAFAIPITLLVEGILVYTVWKFRNTGDPQPTQENRRLEITWTVATALVLVFVGTATYGVLASPWVTAEQGANPSAAPGEDPVVVEVTAQQWFWRFTYPEADVTTDTLVVPTDRPVVFEVQTADVIHAFHVPELGLKADAIPGQTNQLQTRIYETGTYTIFCAEYCGAAHAEMLADLEVRSPAGFQRWLDEQGASQAVDSSERTAASGASDQSDVDGTATRAGSAVRVAR